MQKGIKDNRGHDAEMSGSGLAYVAKVAELDLEVFAKARRVVVDDSLGVAKGLKKRIHLWRKGRACERCNVGYRERHHEWRTLHLYDALLQRAGAFAHGKKVVNNELGGLRFARAGFATDDTAL